MRCARGRAGLDDVIRSIVSLDPRRVGNRGSHRYSCGTAECTHQQHAWAALVDPPALMAILASAGVRYEQWMKFTPPLYGGLVTLGCVSIAIAIAIGLQ